MKQPLVRMLTGAAGLLVLLLVLVLANVLASQLRLRADVTGERLYTLSDGTLRQLDQVDRDITLKFYCTRGADGLPMTFKQYGQRILDLLREYEARSKGRIVLEVIDPEPDSDDEEWAGRYGLVGTPLDPRSDGPSVYLGLVALAGARQQAIPFFSPADEPQLEYLVTRLIGQTLATTRPRLGVLSSLPVMGMPGSFMNMNRGQDAWVFMQELRTQYDVVELPPGFDEVPADINTVLAIHPRGLRDITLFALDQFVLRGGHLVAFVDPLCLSQQDEQAQAFRDPAEARSDLNRLTSAWGLTLETDRVVADAKSATRVSRSDGQTERNLSWLSFRPENFNRSELAVAGLDIIMLPMAGAFRGQPAEGLTLTPLLTAGAGAGLMSAMEATMGASAGASSFQRAAEPLNVAVRLTGTFKTAFPEGRPQDEDRPADVPGAPSKGAGLKESAQPGAVVLVGDVDLLSEAYSVRRLPAFGRAAYQLLNDNVSFVANLAGQMAGNDALIGLRSRGTFDRPFTRVLALQQEAQEKWRQEEVKLQERLQETQMKVNELQAMKDPAQRLVITPEQQKEMDRFRQQMIETRRQLKDVRKNLRREIERLGLWLKGINTAAMPAAVILLGLTYGWIRRRRARG